MELKSKSEALRAFLLFDLLFSLLNLGLFKQCSIIYNRWYYMKSSEMDEGVCFGYYSLC